MHVTEVAADLATEQQVLDDLLTGITDADWATPTSSPRWSVADQVAHLTYCDGTAALAITDPDRFRTMLDDLVGVAGGGDGAVDDLTLGRARKMSPPGVFEAWRANRRLLADAAATLADDSRGIWLGRPLYSTYAVAREERGGLGGRGDPFKKKIVRLTVLPLSLRPMTL